MNIKAIIASAAVAAATIFTPAAEAGVACGSSSFVINSDYSDAYMMFHNGGNATFTDDYGNKAYGRWMWSGSDAVTRVAGVTLTWENARNATCDFHY